MHVNSLIRGEQSRYKTPSLFTPLSADIAADTGVTWSERAHDLERKRSPKRRMEEEDDDELDRIEVHRHGGGSGGHPHCSKSSLNSDCSTDRIYSLWVVQKNLITE